MARIYTTLGKCTDRRTQVHTDQPVNVHATKGGQLEEATWVSYETHIILTQRNHDSQVDPKHPSCVRICSSSVDSGHKLQWWLFSLN